jgi:hypothetical protein
MTNSISSPFVTEGGTAVPVKPESLTFEQVKQWDPVTMKKYMQIPEMREAIYRVATEGRSQVQQPDQAQVSDTPAEPVVATVPEVPPVEVQPVAPEPPKKAVVEYQIRDEEGNPIGRPTHLEAATQEELIEKMKEAHTQATRAFHRLKKQKVQSLREVNSQQPAAPAAPAQMSDADLLAAVKDLKSDDPKVALEAHRKLNKAEQDRIQAEADAKVAAANELRRQEQVSYQFLRNHQTDFYNCAANIKLIEDYFKENELPWTIDNLEVAFHDLENQLAPVVAPVAAVPPANPVPAAVSTTPAVAVTAQPVAAAPVVTTPPANPVPAQPRPGVNGGIVPGQNSAVRPAAAPKGLTMDEINSWDGPTMRTKMRNPQTRSEIERVVAEAKIRRGR